MPIHSFNHSILREYDVRGIVGETLFDDDVIAEADNEDPTDYSDLPSWILDEFVRILSVFCAYSR